MACPLDLAYLCHGHYGHPLETVISIADTSTHGAHRFAGGARPFAEGLEPGPLVIQNGELIDGWDDGRCVVMVTVAPDADVAAEVARVATVNGWSDIEDGWLSPDGVSMTYDAIFEPEAMGMVGLQGRRTESP